MHEGMYAKLAPARTVIYKGRRYASRSEGKWAIVLSELKISFYYEPETFSLKSGLYLPDFYLPELDCYLEIKPANVDDVRYLELGYMLGKRVFVARGDMPHIPNFRAPYAVYDVLRGHIWQKFPYREDDYMLGVERSGRANFAKLAYPQVSTVDGMADRVLDAYITASTFPFVEMHDE